MKNDQNLAILAARNICRMKMAYPPKWSPDKTLMSRQKLFGMAHATARAARHFGASKEISHFFYESSSSANLGVPDVRITN